MNSLIIVIISLIWLASGYKFYGKILKKKVINPDDKNKTPANTQKDGIDYYPARPVVLFGHHFSSIAGAGPIVGPIIATAAFGWGPIILWVLLGSVLLGGVHDYFSLMTSVRMNGKSIPDITSVAVSERARKIFLVFVWLALVLVVAVFAVVTSQTLIISPEIVIPTFMLIPIAILFGISVYKLRFPLWISTIIAFLVLLLFIYLGIKFPISFPFNERITFLVWFTILIIYGYFASITGVWILLQPRDYISSWILIIGTFLGLLGIFWVHPDINAPVFTGFTSNSQGPLWPMMFILVACGAISGFHSIVSSGTTAKQLSKESQGFSISYGAMLAESVIAVIATMAVAAGLYWTLSEGKESLFFPRILSEGGPINAFGSGFGVLTKPFFGFKLGTLIGIIMINAFVLTTLDTAVRLARFLGTELLGNNIKLMKNRWFASLVAVIPAFYIGESGAWNVVWPIFGASNQLVAGLVLIVLTSYIISKNKPSAFTLYPAIFMIITTTSALIYQLYKFILDKNWVLIIIASVLIFLSILISIESIKVINRHRSKKSVIESL